MPVQVIEKPKAEPMYVKRAPALVPLRVAAHANDTGNSVRHDKVCKEFPIGTVCFVVHDNDCYSYRIFNTVTGTLAESWAGDYLRFLNAYNVEQIVVCQDSNPAPA